MKYFICLILIVFCSANSAFSITEGDKNPFIEWGKSDISLSFGETNGAKLLQNSYPGLFVTAILPLKNENKMLLIKNSYILEGKDFGDVSEVISGVDISDKIVTNPNYNLMEGQIVKAVKSN